MITLLWVFLICALPIRLPLRKQRDGLVSDLIKTILISIAVLFNGYRPEPLKPLTTYLVLGEIHGTMF